LQPTPFVKISRSRYDLSPLQSRFAAALCN
jgi:hypothetical protein